MNIVSFVARVRDHYVEQFVAFAEEQRRSCTQGAAEVKFQLGPDSKLFRSLYCVDFIKNDGRGEAVEFRPENVLTFDPIADSFGGAALRIEHLRWDDVLIYHDLDAMPEAELGSWFERWFGPKDERHVPGAEAGNVVHSLLLHPLVFSIDFGTAAPKAFWDMLELIARAGATQLRITSAWAEAKNSA